ncbi:MAG: hypothetical protein CME70_01495 [Halobacteriovorax sp.]|nr:hypothetical protein [Halobacteriovorax sp.]|tara:strand:- start:1846 stop:2553 length:708 start_codon:yes stop_codon:yes gene_type:complete
MIDLRKYAASVYSQKGEDGMIKKVFDTLQINTGHAVELGAWDGIYCSNVYNLIKKGWSATLIEGDKKKYSELVQNMSEYKGVDTELKIISLEKDNTLNDVLNKFNVPDDFDILSLDLDGCDYWIWRALKFKPKLVVVEYNSNWEDAITVPYSTEHVWDGTQYYGASGKALCDLASHKGYDLIGHVPNSNLFFLDSNLNNGLFEVLDIDTGFHISKNHHKPMSPENFNKLVINPPL